MVSLAYWRCKVTTLYVYVVITSGLQVPLAVVDSLYYGKFVLAPLNILWYNVFRRGGGPDLYGKTSLVPRPHRKSPPRYHMNGQM